jgi:phosphoglycerate kinase
MAKKTVDDICARGRRVLVRLDLNVPLDNGRITDDRRIRAALPTLAKLLRDGGRIICMSHLGRPDGEPENRASYTLAPVAERMQQLLGLNVRFAEDCVGPPAKRLAAALQDGDVGLLENLRFHEAEQIKDKVAAENPKLKEQKESFARQIADLGDAYVNDAFGTCHRDNASMLTVPKLMSGKPRVAGYLVQKELKFLGEAMANPKRPFVCVLGGAKVSDKLGVIKSLLGKCETILIGGAMAYTFLAASGAKVGRSKVEPELFDTARQLCKESGSKLQLPTDSVVAAEIKKGVSIQALAGDIPDEKMGLDIGPATIERYQSFIHSAKTVFWNGPMGVFETPPFDVGTVAMAKSLAKATGLGAVTVVGGGDSAAALDQAGLADRISHISTGGGASLEFLEGKTFKPLEVLDDA